MIKGLVQKALRSRGLEIRRIGARPGGGEYPPLRTKREALELIRSAGFVPDVVFDIGVADGTEGLYGVWSDARYILVEPLAKFTPALEAICSRHRSAKFHIAAAGEAPGELSIGVHPSERYTIRLAENAPPDWPRATIPIITADSLLADLPSDASVRRAVLKIDVDGPELSVLKGARSILSLDTVVIIEAALLDEEVGRFGRIVEFMSGAGYECFDILEPMFRGDRVLWQVDLLFVHRDSALRKDRHYFRPSTA